MPRILVTNDDGAVFWSESFKAPDFMADHFRRCLADRLGWAVADAEGPAATNVRPIRPAPARRPRTCSMTRLHRRLSPPDRARAMFTQARARWKELAEET